MIDAIEVQGFVVVPPLSDWEKEYSKEMWADAHSTFGLTAAEAWYHAIHISQYEDKAGFSREVQKWFDLGYRVKKAKLEIYDM